MKTHPNRITSVLLVLVMSAANTAWAQQGAGGNRPITVHVIGFEVDGTTAGQLGEMASAGGGRYFPAENEAELSAALGAAAGIALQPTLSNEQEGNSSFGTANHVNASGSVSGSIDPVGDKDYYSFEVDHPGTLEFQVTGVSANLAIMVRIYNQEGSTHLNWVKPLRAGAETTGVAHLTKPGRYTLALADASGKEASASPYSLSMQFLPGDGFEMNNSFGAATPIAHDQQLYASIHPKGDTDWYRFETERRGALHVSITESPAETDLVFRIYNAEGSVHRNWLAPLRAGGDNIQIVDLPAAGRWYLHIADSKSDAFSPQNYNLQLAFKAGDSYEPNDSIGRAVKVDPTCQLMSTISDVGDKDFFFIEVDHPGAIDVNIDNVDAALDLHLRVYNAEGSVHVNWMAPLSPGAENHNTIDLAKPGRYYFQVGDGKNDARSPQPYTLSLNYHIADNAESNNTLGTAVPISTGAAIHGTILPRRDHDCYSIEIPSPGDYQIAVTQVAPELDIHVRVYNAERRVHKNWIAPLRAGADTIETVAFKEAGTYLIEVVDGKDDARSTQPYTLTISGGKAAP